MRPSRTRLTGGAALLGAGALAAATLSVIPATADEPSARHNPTGTVTGVMDHLIQFEQFGDRYGSRASGTRGYKASANYIVSKMNKAGYKTRSQAFDFPFFQQTGPSTFERTAPTRESYTEGEDYALMTYSDSGDVVDKPVEAVDATLVEGSTSGCEDTDFAGFTPGNIALIRRGTCTFGEKAVNAEEAGAAAVIIFNQGNSPDRTGVVAGTLGAPDVTIPVIGTSTAVGESLLAPDTRATVKTSTISEIRKTWNVIAQTRGGNPQNVVMAGAHLDSVIEGNGINDNGSGSAALLETAEAMADMKGKPNNKVRFAWWGAEELGLLGSEHYVAKLSENQPGKFQNIALYLNFDMVGSPNYMLGVYDGNGDSFDPPESTEAPKGSAAIERKFHRYFRKLGTGSVDTAFSGRSDYGPFIALNVPAGGLFTGAEGIKSPEEAALFGGTAGEPYDACYHQACDDLGNLSRAALKANLGAIMETIKKYSKTTKAVNGKRTGHQPPPPEESPRKAGRAQDGHDHAVAR